MNEVIDGYICTKGYGCEYTPDEFIDNMPPCSECIYLMAVEDLP